MNNSKIYCLLSLLLMLTSEAFGYVHNQTKSGVVVHWPAQSTTIDLFVNPQNSEGLLDSELQAMVGNSIAEWNGVSRINIRQNETPLKAQENFNEFYFSNDPNIFNGLGVIGVTQVGFKNETGEIVEADILINENFTFSSDPLELKYLGNVITHEVGHFLGLGHGQVSGSTMFYALTRGQHKIADDDKAGLYSTYPSGDPALGSLSGTIVGGRNLTKVFGTHVQALSVKTGKIMGASISELNGKFRIDGLPQNDQYLIYTSPIQQLGLPSNYANARSDFCEASKKYRGSFFQSCGSSAEGYPQAVSLNSSALEVGNITIRCGLDSPPEYLQQKNMTPTDFDLNDTAHPGLGGSFVGFFSSAEMSAGDLQDFFRLNLSQVNWSALSVSPSLYLELKILNQTFYSPFKANIVIKRPSGNTTIAAKYIQESDGWLNLETVARVPINRVLLSDNNFEIQVSPESMESSLPAGIPLTNEDYFPSYAELKDGLFFYLATATIVEKNADGSYAQVSSKTHSLSENTQCPDAVNTYALASYNVNGTSSNSERKKAAGCGTVDMDSGTGSGPGGFLLGLFCCFILSYALSRYSKMA